MENIVGVVRGNDKLLCMDQLLNLSGFDDQLFRIFEASGKDMNRFKIVIKPNMMVFVNPKDHTALVTDKELVEFLVDHLVTLGFSDIALCEAQHDMGRILKNHNVGFVAGQIGYKPEGRYKIIDLSLEEVGHEYSYQDDKGYEKKWRDTVGITWRDADFRISFAKCKTHEHDWLTLCVKNIYGCFPAPDKLCKYHIKNEVAEVTGRSLRNFPVHFALVDAWVGSDGFQGYKIPHPQTLQMLFGGSNAIAVDMEVFKRAGLNPRRSKILKASVKQLYNGAYPPYIVKGDQTTLFHEICSWENVSDETVETIDTLEEVYVAWGFLNLKPAVTVDYELFPPKGLIERFLVWMMKQLYSIFKLFRWYRRIYERKKSKDSDHKKEISL